MKRPLLLLALALLCHVGVAGAQTDNDRAAAQALFDEGQQLKEEGDLDAACEKFEKSQKLDAAVGTQLNLADCYEKQGRTASAWVNYSEASQLDQADERRAKFARERAQALKPMLTLLRVEVASKVRGLTITRDGVDIPEATWGTAVPVDPGNYEVVARAPGKLPWRDDIEVAGEGEEIALNIPPLADAGDGDLPPDPEPAGEDEAGGTSGLLVAGIVVGAVGIVGLGAGAVLAGMAHSKAGDSKEFCPDDPNECTAEGVALREDAQKLQTIYAVSFAVGGAAAVAGLVMILAAPSDDEGEAALTLAPYGTAGLSLRGRF